MYPIDMYLIDLLLIVFKRKRPHITYVTWGLQTPPVGLEPTTLRLTAECSTDWAKEEYSFFMCTFKTTYKESLHHFLPFRVPSMLTACNTGAKQRHAYSRFGYALDLLVTVSSTCYHASTSALSTSSSSRGLTNLTLWDISSWGGLHA